MPDPSRRRLLVRTAREQRRPLVGAVLGLSGHQAGEALVPVVIGVVIDRAVDGGGPGDLLRWLAGLAAVFVFLSYAYRFGARAGERASEQAAHSLRLALTRRTLDPRGGADSRLPGELTSIATSDAARVGGTLLAAPAGLAAAVALLVGGGALLVLSVPLGLLVLLGGPVLLWLVGRLGRPLEQRSEAEQERAAHASGVAADLISGLRVLKGIGAERAAVDRYRVTSRLSLAATLRAVRAQAAYDGAVLALSGAFLALVALVGARLAQDGEITIGQLVAAVGLAQFLLGPLTVFGWVGAELAQARASAGRIATVLETPPAVPAGHDAPAEPVRGHLAVREAGLAFEARPGELLGVVPGDPAGGPALLRLLGREADPADGAVTLDGADLAGLDPDLLRRAVLVAAHDADLFGGTLAENVGADDPAALRAGGADEVAAALPQGAATVLAERGRSLSGGQRQRVALARALAAHAPVLVLHDPTTAVDAVTEARIAAGVRELRRGRTTLLVTSSPTLLAVADRVLLVDGGTVTAEGTHAELVRTRADYREVVLS
jgi:putative ABC transport system ATP-binding protein